MATPAEDPQVHGQGPGRVSLPHSSGTEDEKSDSYQVFPDYSQLVPDRTVGRRSRIESLDAPSQFTAVPISRIMSTRRLHTAAPRHSPAAPPRNRRDSLLFGPLLFHDDLGVPYDSRSA